MTPIEVLCNAQARVLHRYRMAGEHVIATSAQLFFAKVRSELPAVRRKFKVMATAAAILSLSACSSMRPIAEYGHISHASQHIDGTGNDFGCNYVGAGVRIKGEKFQIDLLESYSIEQCQGPYNETFVGRINWEF